MSPPCNSLHSIEIDESSVTAAIRKLKNGKAVGPDNIPGVTVQNALLKLKASAALEKVRNERHIWLS